MQFILTQEEMDAQRQQMASLARLPPVEDLQKFCTFVSDNLILTTGWRSGKVWGCILTREREWYCDDCPAKDVCPHPNKEWSK